jgi:hypothetical protein
VSANEFLAWKFPQGKVKAYGMIRRVVHPMAISDRGKAAIHARLLDAKRERT